MISTVEKIRNIELGRGYELTQLESDEEVIRGEFKVNNDELTYNSPYGIEILFEDELDKIKAIPEIEDVDIYNVCAQHYEEANYDYIVKFVAFKY